MGRLKGLWARGQAGSLTSTSRSSGWYTCRSADRVPTCLWEALERAPFMPRQPCPHCQGDGELSCPNCCRSGYREDIFDHMFGRFCCECGGRRKVECPLCDGRGTIYAYKGG